MIRRGEKRSADVSNPRVGSDCRAPGEAGEADGSEGQRGTPSTIEISDEDYRTLHLPCDTLEEGDSFDCGDSTG
jgi:hypothetical protein